MAKKPNMPLLCFGTPCAGLFGPPLFESLLFFSGVFGVLSDICIAFVIALLKSVCVSSNMCAHPYDRSKRVEYFISLANRFDRMIVPPFFEGNMGHHSALRFHTIGNRPWIRGDWEIGGCSFELPARTHVGNEIVRELFDC